MLLSAHFTLFVPRLVQILFLLAILTHYVFAVTIDDVFDVVRGDPAAVKGACGDAGGDTDQLLTKWFADSQTLATAANTAVSGTDEISRQLLTAYFGYKKTTAPTDVQKIITPVYDFFVGGRIPFGGGKPKLFCNSGWLKQQSWDDEWINENGKRTQSKIKEIHKITRGEVPFFWDATNEYETGPTGDYCTTPGSDGSKNLASTSDSFKTRAVTLCINNFSSSEKPTLSELDPVDKEEISLSDRRTHSMTLFHEGIHLVNGNANTKDEAYRLDKCILLGAGKKRHNPESFAFYALAQYLSQISDYNFANTQARSKKKPETPTPTPGSPETPAP